MPPTQPIAFDRVKSIFFEASEKTGTERQAFIDIACAGDPALKAEVEAFLSASERVGDFLGSPTPKASQSEGPGTTIGHYKLLQLIGEGGFGSVFMADQEFPVRRKVALKIIKLGMDTKQVIARFEAERQALAMMDHPNIAKVLEAGATEAGRPYFVMELVRGVRITEYCDSQKLTTHQRIELFIQVCNAVQHAHQKGIIHRDIKPSNVLVTMHDDKAVPKIIDFGIAKATNQRLTEKTLFTDYHQFIGTPAYMSPEQAQLSELDVDTRSDIYSLGVVLYELLTGTTPVDAKELLSQGYNEIQRIIREVEPPRPSTRLSAFAEAVRITVADRRHCDSRQLSRTLQGDLDWIVMKCLEKDRTRRYETADALAKDSRRFLNDEAVEASPPSATYRLRRFARRYRRGLQIAGSVALLLTATTVFSVFEAARARRAQAVALVAEKAAKSEAAKSRQVATFLEDVLGGENPVVAQGRDTTILQEILERALSRVDSELAGQPEVRAELYSTIARTYNMEELPGSLELQRKAVALQRSIFKGDNPALALSLYRLAGGLPPNESLACAREALAMRQRLFGDSPATADSLSQVGSLLRRQHQLSQAETVLRQGLDMRKRLKDENSVQYAMNLDELGVALWCQGKRTEGLALTRQAVDLERSVMPAALPYVLQDLTFELHDGGDLQDAKAMASELLANKIRVLPLKAESRLDTAELLARIDIDLGEYGEAERLSRQNRDIDGENPRYMIPLAQVLFNEQKYAEAELLYRAGLEVNRRWFPGGNETVRWNQTFLANLLSAEGKYDQAEPMLRQGLELCRNFSPTNHYEVACSMTCLANSLSDQGKYSEADPIYRDALEIFGASEEPANPGREWGTTYFAYSLLKDGDFARSEPLFREALAAEREKQGGKTAQTRLTAEGLADLLRRTGRVTEETALLSKFGLSTPPTQPATTRPLSAAPIPSDNLLY